MGEGRVGTLRDSYAALNEGDLDAALRNASEDFAINRAGPDPPVRGKDAVRAFMAPEAFSQQTFEPVEFRENGDLVFVWLVVRATGSGSGISIDQEAAHVWQFRGPQAVSLTVVFDREAALEAAGLPRPTSRSGSASC